jgi:hypothetical protein
MASLQKIKFRIVARKCLKFIRGDKENLIKKYEEQERKYLRLIEELTMSLEKQKINFKKEIKELEKKLLPRESLVMRTPSAECFIINDSTITRSSGGDDWKMVLLDVGRERVFSFRAHIHQKKGYMRIGVTDKVTQRERDWAQHEHSIKYGCSYGFIAYATGYGKY